MASSIMMKKTFYYNFFPRKSEEQDDEENKPKAKKTIPRVLLEIRDIPRAPSGDLNNPWHIRKSPEQREITMGMLIFSHIETFKNIFRYWSVDACNYVLSGRRLYVTICDVTDDNGPVSYKEKISIFFQKLCNEEASSLGHEEAYTLGFMDLVQDRVINEGEEIGLRWDTRIGVFIFKMLRRHSGKI